ncbi:hypothetical protein ACFPRL_30385 [Pseudoclavibacter helvolus]
MGRILRVVCVVNTRRPFADVGLRERQMHHRRSSSGQRCRSGRAVGNEPTGFRALVVSPVRLRRPSRSCAENHEATSRYPTRAEPSPWFAMRRGAAVTASRAAPSRISTAAAFASPSRRSMPGAMERAYTSTTRAVPWGMPERSSLLSTPSPPSSFRARS